MDIGANQITTIIVASTTDYIATYSSVFLLGGGLVLALGVMGALLDRFFGSDTDMVMERNGYSSGEFMSSYPGLTAKDRKYYKSKYYPGSRKYKGESLEDDED